MIATKKELLLPRDSVEDVRSYDIAGLCPSPAFGYSVTT